MSDFAAIVVSLAAAVSALYARWSAMEGAEKAYLVYADLDSKLREVHHVVVRYHERVIS
jgi:hypothetical protein